MGLMRTQIFSQEFALYNLTSLLSDVTFFENNLLAQLLVNQTMYFSYNWFDNISTPQVETRDEMIQTVFQEVVQQLSAGYGNDVNDWQYGTVYPMLFGHPIGTSVSLFSFLNNGPIALHRVERVSGSLRRSQWTKSAVNRGLRWIKANSA